MAGKGDKYRPVDWEKYSKEWDKIFNKPKDNPNKKKKPKDTSTDKTST